MRPHVTATANIPAACRGAHVERRVADVRRPGGICTKAFGAEEERRGVGLVALRLVPADNRLEEMTEPRAVERKLSRVAPLRRDDAEPAALLAELNKDALHPETRLELVVERDVVRAVHVDELRDVLGRERLHLRFEPRARRPSA